MFYCCRAGQKVAKHGNYGASSISGAQQCNGTTGLPIQAMKSSELKEIEEANICFLHAPLFHPGIKNSSANPKNLGMRTFFNMLGPMVNPAFPTYQLVGVYNLEMARIYNYLIQQTEKAFTIIHGLDGMMRFR